MADAPATVTSTEIATVAPAEIDFAMDTTGESRARQLPLGRSEAVRRHIAEMAERRARSGQSFTPPPGDAEALGWADYLDLAYDAGLLEPRPLSPRPPMSPPARRLHSVG